MPRYLKLNELNTHIHTFQREPLSIQRSSNIDDIARELRHNNLLLDVPKHLKTQELCKIALQSNSKNLEFIPNHIFTTIQNTVLNCIKYDGMALQYIKEIHQTRELCQAAINQNKKAINYIRNKNLFEELLIKNISDVLKFIPHSSLMITYDFAITALQQDGNLIKHFVDNPLFSNQQLKELCLEAVKQNGLVLKFLREKSREHLVDLINSETHWLLQTQELCEAAINQNGMALEFVLPQFLQNQELCLKAIKQNGLALEFVPNSLQSQEMCLEAINQNGLALEFVPKNLQTQELCLKTVNQNGLALIFVSTEMLDDEILSRLLSNNDCTFVFGFVKLPPDTECLISREPIAEKEKYKVCSLKDDHVISYDSYLLNKSKNICEYCKSELQEKIFFNWETN